MAGGKRDALTANREIEQCEILKLKIAEPGLARADLSGVSTIPGFMVFSFQDSSIRSGTGRMRTKRMKASISPHLFFLAPRSPRSRRF
jgi:hypothetical protein